MSSEASNNENVSADAREHQEAIAEPKNDTEMHNDFISEVCNEIVREENVLNTDELRLTELNNELGSKCRLLETSNEKLKPELEILSQINSELSDKGALHQSVNEDMEYQLKCNENLRSQLTTSEQIKRKLEYEKTLLDSANITLKRENSILQDTCVRYESLNAGNECNIAILTGEKNKVSAECSQLRRQIVALKNQYINFESFYAMTKSQNTKLAAESSELNLRNSKLTGEKGSLNSENIKLKRAEEKLTKKCADLEKRNEDLKSNVAKYESLPVLKDLLDIHDGLQDLDLEKDEEGNSFGEETKKLAEQISEKKAENRRLENELKRKSSYEVINHDRTQQLISAEIELESIRKKVHVFLNRKRQSDLSVVVQNIKKYSESQVSSCKKLQDEGEVLQKRQREESEKILALLDKHNNAMKILIALADADQNHSEHGKDDVCYTVKIINLNESSDYNDHQAVIKIIKHIDEIPEEGIDVQRVGAFNSNQTRLLIVYLPSLKCVTRILKKKGKLKGTAYEGLLIVQTNANERRGKRK